MNNNLPVETKNFIIQPQNMQNPWNGEWQICLKREHHEKVGSLCFEDVVAPGEMLLRSTLVPSYDKAKYIEEIYFAISRFVFNYSDTKELHTDCRHENDHHVRGLEKSGFVYRECKDGTDHYSIKKQKTGWTGLYIFIGIVAGFMAGIVISNLWIGTISGVIIGTLIGYLMDKNEAVNVKR
ncbi:hypothetical protein [Butyrivibrio sp. AE3004]|uniref:hypothetical protein n=1 Tax=Butyrivibrio sp. AE3004 TaxID=1506994 RepID=UPI000494582A|nr:hypothetical protein [Butyrivibrio sp. AE3004]